MTPSPSMTEGEGQREPMRIPLMFGRRGSYHEDHPLHKRNGECLLGRGCVRSGQYYKMTECETKLYRAEATAFILANKLKEAP